MRARRIAELPPYLFAGIQQQKAAALARGVDVLDLGAGVPDMAPPAHVLAALQAALTDPASHRYPPYDGTPGFKQAVAEYYRRRFDVTVDPAREVLALIGSKEGLVHLCQALLDPQDVALVPDPGYPAYATAVRLAGAVPVSVPLEREDGWSMTPARLEAAARGHRPRLLFVNYPGNPTGSTARRADLEALVAWAREREVLVVSDLAYGELQLEGGDAPSLLACPGGPEGVLEFNSLSKSYGMAGWRLGMAVGQPAALAALATLKSHTDTGVWGAIQAAGIAALLGPQEHLDGWRATYRARRDLLVQGLRELGYRADPNPGAFYLWVPVPKGGSSAAFAGAMLDQAGIVVAPGAAYGAAGEGYFRLALTQDVAVLETALARMRAGGLTGH